MTGRKRTPQKRKVKRLKILWLGVALLAAFAVGGALLSGGSNEPGPDTAFSIDPPVADATVDGPVDLRVTLNGAQLGAPMDGLDHLHVSIDGGQLLALYDRPELSLPPPPGRHIAVVDLAGPNHQPLVQAQSVSFIVR